MSILESLPQTLALFGPFTDAFDFVVSGREAQTGGVQVGGPGQVLDLATTQLEVTLLALTVAIVLALPLGLALGHFGRGEFLAVSIGNGGRAIPELALIALMAAAIGVGMVNLVVALAILGIPPILTNAYVGIRQVDRSVVEAARGMGMGNLATILRVELPLAVPLVMGGIRTSAINIVATATIAPARLVGADNAHARVQHRNRTAAALWSVAISALLALLALLALEVAGNDGRGLPPVGARKVQIVGRRQSQAQPRRAALPAHWHGDRRPHPPAHERVGDGRLVRGQELQLDRLGGADGDFEQRRQHFDQRWRRRRDFRRR